MQTKHILGGETRYFREWSMLAAYLVSKLDAPPRIAGQRLDTATDCSIVKL